MTPDSTLAGPASSHLTGFAYPAGAPLQVPRPETEMPAVGDGFSDTRTWLWPLPGSRAGRAEWASPGRLPQTARLWRVGEGSSARDLPTPQGGSQGEDREPGSEVWRSGSGWPSTESVSSGALRVLVVEDDWEMAQLVEQALLDEGYLVEVARDGISGLEAARSSPYAAVILDVLLPGLDGRAVCLKLREEGRRVPVMMLTALGEVVDRVQGLDLGADDYLAKPFSLEEFLARLRALIRRGEQGRPGVLRAGPLRLDRISGHAWRGDHEVELTARESALLELFLRWPGIVLTRDSLLAHVWGDEPGRSSNLITQYVGHLRHKLGLPFAGSDLETIHRVGYRLTVQNRT